MRITNIIAIAFMAIIITALFMFLFYPYSELGTMQDKLNHAMDCLYAICASVAGLVATAYLTPKH